MHIVSAGMASLLRMCAVGLFVVSAIVYWGGWTPTSAAGLLAAGLACLAGSFMHVPEATANPNAMRRERRAVDEPTMRERDRERVRV
jgi:hypothetical protein